MMQTAPESDSPSPTLTLVNRLDDCWVRYRVELKRARSEFAEEYVHDLRVSIRRLIAVMDMGRAVTRQKKMKKSRALLKAHLSAFEKLRDTQVQLVIVEEMQADLPETVVYRDYLREREKQQVLNLQKKIKEFSSAGVFKQITRMKIALRDKNVLEVQAAIWAAVDLAYARVAQDQRAIQLDDLATIHRVRLDFKKFRYRVECIFPLLPGAPADLLLRLHDYQAAMGEIQDDEVGLQMLGNFSTRHHAEVSTVRARFVEMQQARVAAFVNQTDNLRKFWRAAPDQPFPWEVA